MDAKPPFKNLLRTATDPLKTGPSAGQELAKRFARTADGFSNEFVLAAASSLLVDLARQTNPERMRAHARIDEWAAKMHELLDKHYDPATGRRRAIFAFDQTINMKFTDDRKRN